MIAEADTKSKLIDVQLDKADRQDILEGQYPTEIYTFKEALQSAITLLNAVNEVVPQYSVKRTAITKAITELKRCLK